jgi:hypothetical protein
VRVRVRVRCLARWPRPVQRGRRVVPAPLRLRVCQRCRVRSHGRRCATECGRRVCVHVGRRFATACVDRHVCEEREEQAAHLAAQILYFGCSLVIFIINHLLPTIFQYLYR